MEPEIGEMFEDIFQDLFTDPGVWMGMLSIVMVLAFIALAAAVVFYIFHSLGLYTLAKRRGIHHAWMSWVPILDTWILGSLSDQYQYVAKGRIRNRRKVLIGTILAGMVLSAINGFLEGVVFVNLMADDMQFAEYMTGPSILLSILSMVQTGIHIWTLVYSFIAYHDVFASCNPETKTVFLVLGILFNVTLPFFLFADRNKDLGMPPRTTTPPETPQMPLPEEL